MILIDFSCRILGRVQGRNSVAAVGNAATKRSSRIMDFNAHSPMFRNRNFNEERRSRLFDDRPFMYGRLPKLLLAWMFGMQFWAGYYVYHKNALTAHM